MASLIPRKNAKGITTSYQVKWRVNGKQDNESFDTEAQAQMFKKVLEACDHDAAKAERQILAASSDSPKIRDVAETHLKRLSDISVHSMHTYERMLVNHINPTLGDMPVNLLTEEDLAEWVTYMRGKDLSPKTISNVHGFLYSIIKTAIYKKYRADNPCEHTRLPKNDHTQDKTTFLTKGELALILKHLDKHFHPLVLFLVGTGLRFSEATALLPGDFSDASGQYSVRITKAWKRDDKNGREIGPPKTERARRTVPMSKALAMAVAPQIQSRAPDDQVFKMKAGGEVTTQAVHNKAWKPALRAAQKDGLKKSPRIHDLRHTYASWMLGGEPPMSIFDLSRLMGHESINTTSKVYSHLMPEALKRGAETMTAAMGGLFDIEPVKAIPKKKLDAIEA